MDSKYHVGDILKIADFENCIFGVDEPMVKMKGHCVTVTYVGYDNWAKSHYYQIEEDGGEYWWDDACLEPVEVVVDLPEFEINTNLDILF